MSSSTMSPGGDSGWRVGLRALGRYVAWRVGLVVGALVLLGLAFAALVMLVQPPSHGGQELSLLLQVVAGALGFAAAALTLDVDGSLRQADLFERLPVSRLLGWLREVSAGAVALILVGWPALAALAWRGTYREWFLDAMPSVASAAILGFAAAAAARQVGLRPGVPVVATSGVILVTLVVMENVEPRLWMLEPGPRQLAWLRVTEALTLVAAAAALATLAPRRPARRRGSAMRVGLIAACAVAVFLGLQAHATWWLHAPWEHVESASSLPQSSDTHLALVLDTVPAGRVAMVLSRAEGAMPARVPVEWALRTQAPRNDGRMPLVRRRDDGLPWPTRRVEVALFRPSSALVEDVARMRLPSSRFWILVGEDPRDVIASGSEPGDATSVILLRDGEPVLTRRFDEAASALALPDGRFRIWSRRVHFLDPRTLSWEEMTEPEHLVSATPDLATQIRETSSRTPSGEPCVDLLLVREGRPDALLLGSECVPGIEAGKLLERPPSWAVSWGERRAAFTLERAHGLEVVREVWSCDLEAPACVRVAGPEGLPRRSVLGDARYRDVPEVRRLTSDGRVAWSLDRVVFVSGPTPGATTRVAEWPEGVRARADVGPEARCVALEHGGGSVIFWLDGQRVPGRIEKAGVSAWLDEARLIVVANGQLLRVKVTPSGIETETLR